MFDLVQQGKGADVDQHEFLPAGAADDSEDDLKPTRRKKGGAASASSRRSGGDHEALDNIDVTMPLGADEVLPELRHRVVEVYPPGPITKLCYFKP